MPTKHRLAVMCTPQCAFNPEKIGPEATETLLTLRESGVGAVIFTRSAQKILPFRVHQTSVSRHLHHYKEIISDKDVDEAKKLQDLEILDLVIQRGAANSKNWKPSIKDTLDAMKLKTQMTGNSAFDDLLALFDATDDEDEPEEAPEAVLSEAERPDEADEELEDPLV